MTIRVALDTVILAALLDSRDKWHQSAVAIRDSLKSVEAEIFYFDPVINEVVSVLARRLGEQQRVEQFVSLLDQLQGLIPADKITWVSPLAERLYPAVLALVRQYKGELNFHDALIALACKEFGITCIVSFDRDFDHILAYPNCYIR
jgi:predicted nucleic acid-binding protein